MQEIASSFKVSIELQYHVKLDISCNFFDEYSKVADVQSKSYPGFRFFFFLLYSKYGCIFYNLI